MSQPEFLYEVFEGFMYSSESKDFSLNNGLICLWMTGQAKISPKISSYYAKPSKQEKLAILYKPADSRLMFLSKLILVWNVNLSKGIPETRSFESK